MDNNTSDKPIHIHVAKIDGDFDTLLLLIPSIVFMIILMLYVFIANGNTPVVNP